MMLLALLLGVIIIFQDRRTDGCLPRRTSEFTSSFVPVAIQALNHYKSQLQMLYPYSVTPFCGTGKQIPQSALQLDVCVAESVDRLSLFLVDLQREAARQNLEDFQGLSLSLVTHVEKTSRMSAAHQFYFILKQLQKERFGTRDVGCKIREFLLDLENPNSKLYRNFLNLKPLNYLK